MSSSGLPKTPRDLFKFSFFDGIVFNTLISFFERTGLWKYPIKTNGDIENMTLMDKVYWLYKTTSPVRNPRRKSNLETYFDKAKKHVWSLPEGFSAESELIVTSVGDLINHTYLGNSADSLYKDQAVVDAIWDADISMANLECVYFPSDRKFEFNAKTAPPLSYDEKSFDVVKGIGKDKKFSFMATACNHSLDFGLAGVESTIKKLRQEGIAFNGINPDESTSQTATLIEKNGFKIGLVAYTFGLNAQKPPEDRPRIVNRLNINDSPDQIDFAQIKKQIEFCRREKVDFIIAHLHWGYEHEFFPSPEQIEVGHHVAELGVDAIIGHHPHTVQPYEFYTTKRDNARIVPIYYSLGNLVNSFSAPYLCLSAVARIQLAKGLDQLGQEKVYVKQAGCSELYQEVDLAAEKIYLRPA